MGDLPATTAVLSNNQIGRYISRENATILKNVFSATANGFGKAFYQPYEFTVLQDSYAFKFKNKNIRIEKVHSFIVSTLNRVYFKYNWGNKSGWEKVKLETIQLPTKNGEIDFGFMENFIAELEAERVAELEAYLVATGLVDYELTAEEERVLTEFESGKFKWGEFRIEDVLRWQAQKEIDPLKLDLLKDVNEPLFPFYGQSTTNNGIISYNQLINNVLNNKLGNPTILIHSNNQNIVYLETPFYLKDGHGATSVIQSEELNDINQMFFVCVIDKVIKTKYSYNSKATKIELKKTVIALPIKNQQPDYDTMETFISAIQKLVIKDVVIYADRKIEATKSVVKM